MKLKEKLALILAIIAILGVMLCSCFGGKHSCESACDTCGKCKDISCSENACKDKCECEPTSHSCESVCGICGGCTDSACTDGACENKCNGHESADANYVYDTFELKLMSFNIRTAKEDETDPANNWSNRKEWVVKFINECGADFIGMQEVKLQQYEYISQNLDSKYTMLNFPRQTGTDPEGLAVIYDNTKFELISSERYWLSETPEEMSYGWGEGYYRIAVVIILKHIETGELIKAIDTHGPLDSIANKKGYELIMERSVNEGDPFTFLCGDFNAGPTTYKWGYTIVSQELQDCRITAADSSSRTDNTYTGFESYTPGQAGSSIIDHCFVSKGDNVKVLNYEVCFDTCGDTEYWLSDHFPVYATVEIAYKTNILIPGQTGDGFDGELDPAN